MIDYSWWVIGLKVGLIGLFMVLTFEFGGGFVVIWRLVFVLWIDGLLWLLVTLLVDLM